MPFATARFEFEITKVTVDSVSSSTLTSAEREAMLGGRGGERVSLENQLVMQLAAVSYYMVRRAE